MLSKKCYQCNFQCKTSNDNCKCDSCNEGYYLSNYQCLEYNSNCKTCSGIATNCLSCKVGYYLNTCKFCSQCINPCRTCSSSNIFTSCINNHFLASGKWYQSNLAIVIQ